MQYGNWLNPMKIPFREIWEWETCHIPQHLECLRGWSGVWSGQDWEITNIARVKLHWMKDEGSLEKYFHPELARARPRVEPQCWHPPCPSYLSLFNLSFGLVLIRNWQWILMMAAKAYTHFTFCWISNIKLTENLPWTWTLSHKKRE